MGKRTNPRAIDGRLPAGPFQTWIERKLLEYETEFSEGSDTLGPSAQLANELGWSDRTLRRYRYARSESRHRRGGEVVRTSRHTDSFPLAHVEEALHAAGVGLWEIYPEYVKVEFNGTGWCPECRSEVVRSESKLCLWCDAKTDELAA